MEDVTLAEAKERLEELVARAQRGETVSITNANGTVRLTAACAPDLNAPRVTDTMQPFVPSGKKRVAGHLSGKMRVPARLMEPMTDEELRDWYGDDA